jgi:Uma2 family endonuclease
MPATKSHPNNRLSDGQRFVLYNVGWNIYQALLETNGGRPPRMTYHQGDLEFFRSFLLHERYTCLVCRMVQTITEELDIPVVAARSPTLNSQSLDCGLEPDGCYYFSPQGRSRDWNRTDGTAEPPPELAIEIAISKPSLDRIRIYAALGVSEVWRFDGETLSIFLLGSDNAYNQSETSRILPFVPINELPRFLRDDYLGNDTRWGRAFREWVRTTLVPRQSDH